MSVSDSSFTPTTTYTATSAGGERLSDVLYALRRNPITVLGLSIVLIIALAGILAPVLAPYGPVEKSLVNTSEAPSADFWLGTDSFGHDIYSRILYGARLDLLIAVSAVTFSFIVGATLGGISGFAGGWLDEITMRLMDIIQAFPRFIFAMAIAFALGPGIWTVIVATAALNVPGYARLMRSMIISLKERQFALAAKSMGNSPMRVLFRHLVPNSLAPLFVMASLHCGWAILEAAGLSFIGLGVPVPTAEWGVMINIGLQDFLRGEWWSYTFPSVAIMITVLGFNLFGDGLDDILDPRRQ
ncbi:ABC transporter permease [Chloroflexi bacterium TSY]|nr:ABC transporter permease [Chloroflexi bacterium TSY]